MLLTQAIPQEVLNAQAIFVSHSGGKDSQAMLAYLIRLGLKDKLVIVHSDLGDMEWEPMGDWIKSISFGCPVNVIEPPTNFWALCRKYKRLPGGNRNRFCTSELKTRPINNFIKEYCRNNGLNNVISAIGLRSQESKVRAEKEVFTRCKASNKKIRITEWLPIKDFLLENVWEEIAQASQVPHKVYSQGFSRLSCVFCVFGRIGEHKLAAQLKPELAQKFAQLEHDLGKAIRLKQIKKVKYPKYLTEYTAIKLA
jgi:3'-phosphoadenosine 5'-phosphosulfate sulfotransferase (PAPS reductase)/FAD synthetase